MGCFDQKRVGATRNQAEGLFGERLFEQGVGDVAEGGQLGAWPHRPEHPTHAAVAGFIVFGDLAGDASAGLGELFDTVFDFVVAEV